MKYHIITYGCQMNKSDSERIAAVLENIGYQPASNINGADLIVVNACSVRQSAIDRIHGIIPKFKKLKTKNYKLKTILTGCALKEDKRKFAKKFDLILDIKDLPKLPQLLQLIFNETQPRNEVGSRCRNWTKNVNYLQVKPRYQTPFRAYVPIITGCNNFCSYCVVPYTRGREISRPAEEIICEVKNLIKKGYKEVWLLGENVNSYSWNMKHKTWNKINFPRLLRMVNNLPGKFWIRFTSPYPKPSTRAKPRTRAELGSGLSRTELRSSSGLGAGLVPHPPHQNLVRGGAGDFSWDELINVMAECKKVTEYINLPVQSGDDQILQKMNRPYTVKQYKNLVQKIRKKIPGVCLSTDAIVGFPGETKWQFQNTVKLFKKIKFDMAYIAQYSERAGTAAAKMKDDVPHQEKERRYKVLTEVLKETALGNNRKFIGEILTALPEEIKNEFLIGKTRTYKTIKFKGPKNLTPHQSNLSTGLIGQFVRVKIVDALPWGLSGQLSCPKIKNKRPRNRPL